MAKAYANTIKNRKRTVQTEVIPGREKDMVKNNAGGMGFKISDKDTLDRFLILGTEGGTYYQTESKLTEQNATKVKKIIQDSGVEAVKRIIEVSDKGLAQKNSSAIFALALAASYGDNPTKDFVARNVGKVCRTGTHLFEYMGYVSAMRGLGRSARRGINNWYTDRSESSLANQVAKYQSRNGWKHSDVIRLTHPKFDPTINEKVIKWVMNKETTTLSPLLEGFEKAKKASSVKEVLKLISDYNLPRECIPTQFLNDVGVWEHLLPNMGLTALIRNLGKMSSIGLLNKKPFNNALQTVLDKLSDKDALKAARVHPISILYALKTYGNGRGLKGALSWTPVADVKNALDAAFYLAFDYLEPTGKRIVYGVDISGSMGWSSGGILTAAEMAAAMSMALARSEKQTYIMGFSDKFVDLDINKNDKLEQVLRKTSSKNFGRTDVAIPFTWGKKEKVEFDAAVILTDNESYAGPIHVTQAVKEYRNWSGNPNVRLVAAAFTASHHSVVDPTDPLQINMVGMSADLPSAVTKFLTLGEEKGGKQQEEEVETDE